MGLPIVQHLKKNCFISVVQFSRYLQWEGRSGPCYSTMAGRRVALYFMPGRIEKEGSNGEKEFQKYAQKYPSLS